MIKNIKVIFDRRKTFEKTGKGTIDICIYLKEGERKFESVAQSTPEKWEAVVQSKDIQAKLLHYEHIINAMTVLGEDMTIKNFNSHVFQVLPDFIRKRPFSKLAATFRWFHFRRHRVLTSVEV